MSNKIRCVLKFKKGITLTFIVGLSASPQPVKSSLPGLPACQLLLPVTACRGVSLHVLQAFFLRHVRTQMHVKAKHLTGETLVSLWRPVEYLLVHRSLRSNTHSNTHRHTHTHTHTQLTCHETTTDSGLLINAVMHPLQHNMHISCIMLHVHLDR